MTPGGSATETQWRASLQSGWSRLVFTESDESEGKSMDWLRSELRAAFRPYPRVELELVTPFDVKRILYSDGDVEMRAGIADFQQWVAYSFFEVIDDSDELSLGAGLSIPTGKVGPRETEDQETLQFGNGTFDPLLRVRYSVMPAWWGFGVQAAGQVPLYRNRYGYLGAPRAELSLSFRTKPLEWLGVDVSLTGMTRGPSSWDGEREHGYSTLLVSTSLHWAPAEWMFISTSGGYRLASISSEGGTLPKPQFIASLRLTLIW